MVVEPESRRGDREMLDMLRNTVLSLICKMGQMEGQVGPREPR